MRWVKELTANAGATPQLTMMIPAMAGPPTRARLKMTAVSAIAADRLALLTRLGTIASRTGQLNAALRPLTSTRTPKISTVINPAKVSPQRRAELTATTAWPKRRITSRSMRSATTPASGERKTVGNNSAKAIIPSQVPDSVSSQTSQPVATRCSQVPK